MGYIINDFWEKINDKFETILWHIFETGIIHANPLCLHVIYAQPRVIIRIGGAICRVFHRLLYRFAV